MSLSPFYRQESWGIERRHSSGTLASPAAGLEEPRSSEALASDLFTGHAHKQVKNRWVFCNIPRPCWVNCVLLNTYFVDGLLSAAKNSEREQRIELRSLDPQKHGEISYWGCILRHAIYCFARSPITLNSCYYKRIWISAQVAAMADDDDYTDCCSKIIWYATLCFDVCRVALVRMKPFQASKLPNLALSHWRTVLSKIPISLAHTARDYSK